MDEGIKSVVQRIVVIALQQVLDQHKDWQFGLHNYDSCAVKQIDRDDKRIVVSVRRPADGSNHDFEFLLEHSPPRSDERKHAADVIRRIGIYSLLRNADEQGAMADVRAYVSRAIDSL